MKSRAALTGCFIFIAFSLTAQQLIFKTYTVEDGLVANPVRRIFQDSRGFIWIATWEGLSKYDGNKFTNYTTANGLSHNMVNDIFESTADKLYIAENNGSVDILQQDAIVKKAAFENVVINQFYITKNNRVIAATDTGGVQEIKNGTLLKPSQQFPGASYNDFTELNDSFLLGGSEGSLTILNGKFEIISEIKQPRELQTFKIYKDLKSNIWVGTNKGLKLLSPFQKNSQPPLFTLLPAPFNIPVLKDYIINDIMEDANGRLWIATPHGLVKIDPNGSWQVFLEKDGLPSSNIACIYQDIENNIWIGTALGLVKVVTKNDLRIYTFGQGVTSTKASYMLPLENDLFLIGTDTGPQLYETTTTNFLPVRIQHDFLYTGFVKNSRPLLFFANNNKFGKYDSNKKQINDFIAPGPPASIVFCSVMDANGIIFNGAYSGLVIRSPNKTYAYNKFPYRITDLHIDKKGRLWVGTWNNGLYRIDYSSIKNSISLVVHDFSNLLPDKNIRCLYEDDKANIWIGTRYKGIVKLKDAGGEQYDAQYFDLQSGLMSNWVRAIAEGAKGSIWIGSDLGIDKLIPSDTSYHVFNFSRINNYFAQINAISSEINHSLWLTTSRGFTNIIDGETEKTPPAPVYITSVGLGDTTFNYHLHELNKKVELKYNKNQARFEFSAPAFINEKQILYSYRLLGSADTTWSEPANMHTVSYASLQPGTYQFEVRTKVMEQGMGYSCKFCIRYPLSLLANVVVLFTDKYIDTIIFLCPLSLPHQAVAAVAKSS
jgi:ligand-binding sensor domain-containing protein